MHSRTRRAARILLPEKRLAAGPVINVPTITLESDANGAPHPDASSYAKKFSSKYAHRIIEGGVAAANAAQRHFLRKAIRNLS